MWELVLAAVFGYVVSEVSADYRIPKTISLILFGFALGPALGVFKPLQVPGFSSVIEICLFLILFEGGLSIRAKALEEVEFYVVLFSILGVVLTILVVAGFSSLVVPLSVAVLLAVIVSDTDPVGVYAVTEEVKQREEVVALVEAESTFNDVCTSLLALYVVFPVLRGAGVSLGLMFGFLGFILLSLLVGVCIGEGMDELIRRIHRRTWNTSLVVLSIILIYLVSSWLRIYSYGVAFIAAVFMHEFFKDGIWFWHLLAELIESLVFVSLGAMVSISGVLETAPVWIIMAFAIVFVARPLTVFSLTWNGPFSNDEKWFMSFVGMRGVTSALLAILAVEFYPLAVPVCSSVIFFTTIVQSMGAVHFSEPA